MLWLALRKEMMRKLTKNVSDKRRAAELDKSLSTMKKFSSVPNIKHLDDGQVAVITGSGQLVWRDGNKLYVLTGTEN